MKFCLHTKTLFIIYNLFFALFKIYLLLNTFKLLMQYLFHIFILFKTFTQIYFKLKMDKILYSFKKSGRNSENLEIVFKKPLATLLYNLYKL